MRAKTRGPARRGDRADEDLAGLDLIELLDRRDHPGRPLGDPARRCDAAQLIRGDRTVLSVEPAIDRIRRDPPEHDRERLVHRLRRGSQRRRRRPLTELLHDPLAFGDLLRPVRGAASGSRRRPPALEVVEGRVDLVAVEVEDVFLHLEEPMLDKDASQLAHLVPEDRVMPVLHVEVVVLDVGVDAPGERDEVVEGLPILLAGQQLTVFAGDPLALAGDLLERAGDVLARLELLDVAPHRGEREPQVVHPGAVLVVVAGPRRVPEPRLLCLLERSEPAVSAGRLADPVECLLRGDPVLDQPGQIELDGEAGELAELVVGAEEEDVDPDDHPGDRLVEDSRERALAEVTEGQVGRVPEVQHLEVVVRHLVHVLEQAAVGREQVEGGHEPTPLDHEPFVLDLGQAGDLDCDQPLNAILGLHDPLVVEAVPVLVVVAGPLHEVGHPLLDHLRIGDRVRADVEVAVYEPLVDAERRRDHPDPCRVLVEGDPPALGHDRVERVDRLGVVHAVEEPEFPVLELPPLLAERVVVGVEAAPVLGAWWCLDLEGAREAPGFTHGPTFGP